MAGILKPSSALMSVTQDMYLNDTHKGREAFSKVKQLLRKAKARTLEVLLFEATAQALCAVSVDDAHGYFEHCGYVETQDHPL